MNRATVRRLCAVPRRTLVTSLLAASATTWCAISQAQTTHRPVTSSADVCEIGDMGHMSASRRATVDYSGSWILDLSQSEGLPALWRTASGATMIVTQDPARLAHVLTVRTPDASMPYPKSSYRLDGSPEHTLGGARGQTEMTTVLRYAAATGVVVLRLTESATLADVRLFHETTQRWELDESRRTLRVCRMLKGPLTRTVTKLVFTRK